MPNNEDLEVFYQICGGAWEEPVFKSFNDFMDYIFTVNHEFKEWDEALKEVLKSA
ncbi:hypothetical protein [Desulfoluna sp.]|uniref:hypothetical protein n=1 Tax=Desulfoluna sp. TaxID=2045199 RepID=UPI0026118343|nr:hypothetical protein [Desulfoluna sp.]